MPSERSLIARQRYIYHWTVPQICAWWLDRAVQLIEHEVTTLLESPPPDVVNEVRAKSERERRTVEKRHARRWELDRRSLRALAEIAGRMAVEASERGDAKEFRAMAATLASLIQTAKDLPDESRARRATTSDVMGMTPEEITSRWKELV